MGVEFITKEDLDEFRKQLLQDLGKLFADHKERKRWLKTPDVMDLLGISDVTLSNLRASGTIPFKKLGGICYYDREELERTLEQL